jgi:hypothetical protein
MLIVGSKRQVLNSNAQKFYLQYENTLMLQNDNNFSKIYLFC